MNLQIAPLSEQLPWGAMVTGLKSGDIDNPSIRQTLVNMWIDKGLLVFRGLAGEEDHIRLSEVFGKLEIHPLVVHRPDSHPKLVKLTYRYGKGALFEVHGQELGAWLPWHSDLIYGAKINHGGILRAVTVPRRGGQTGYIDQIAAYDTLPANIKERIEHLNVLYRLNLDCSQIKYNRDPEIRMTRKIETFDETMRLYSQRRSVHPLVFVQEETGRRVLNLSPWFADGIEGMENEEGDDLLELLVRHTVDPANAYHHDWQEEDMVLWDNWRMLHRAVGVPVDEEREVQRTTIHGDYALGRWENDEEGETPEMA